MSKRTRVSILGATGSVGESALSVIGSQGPDSPQFEVVALTANTKVEALAAAAIATRAEVAVIADETKYGALKSLLAGTGIEAAGGHDAVNACAARPADVVVAGIVGIVDRKSVV